MDVVTAGFPADFPWQVIAIVFGGVIVALIVGIAGLFVRRLIVGSQDQSSSQSHAQWTQPVVLFLIGGTLVVISLVVAMTWLSVAEKDIPDGFSLVLTTLLIFMFWATIWRRW